MSRRSLVPRIAAQERGGRRLTMGPARQYSEAPVRPGAGPRRVFALEPEVAAVTLVDRCGGAAEIRATATDFLAPAASLTGPALDGTEHEVLVWMGENTLWTPVGFTVLARHREDKWCFGVAVRESAGGTEFQMRYDGAPAVTNGTASRCQIDRSIFHGLSGGAWTVSAKVSAGVWAGNTGTESPPIVLAAPAQGDGIAVRMRLVPIGNITQWVAPAPGDAGRMSPWVGSFGVGLGWFSDPADLGNLSDAGKAWDAGTFYAKKVAGAAGTAAWAHWNLTYGAPA